MSMHATNAFAVCTSPSTDVHPMRNTHAQCEGLDIVVVSWMRLDVVL